MQKQTPQNPYPTPTSPAQIASQFGMTPIPNHQHTGADSPQVQYKNIANVPAPTPTGVTSLIAGTGISVSSATGAVTVTNTQTSAVIHGGQIVSGGTAGTFFPSGWTVASLGTGHYQVTHNLGTTNYAVVAMCSPDARTCDLYAFTNNTFDIVIIDIYDNPDDGNVQFILTTTK